MARRGRLASTVICGSVTGAPGAAGVTVGGSGGCAGACGCGGGVGTAPGGGGASGVVCGICGVATPASMRSASAELPSRAKQLLCTDIPTPHTRQLRFKPSLGRALAAISQVPAGPGSGMPNVRTKKMTLSNRTTLRAPSSSHPVLPVSTRKCSIDYTIKLVHEVSIDRVYYC